MMIGEAYLPTPPPRPPHSSMYAMPLRLCLHLAITVITAHSPLSAVPYHPASSKISKRPKGELALSLV